MTDNNQLDELRNHYFSVKAKVQAAIEAPGPEISLSEIFDEYIGEDWYIELLLRMRYPLGEDDAGQTLENAITDAEEWFSHQVWEYRVLEAGRSTYTRSDEINSLETYISAMQAADDVLSEHGLTPCMKVMLRSDADAEIKKALQERISKAKKLLGDINATPAKRGPKKDEFRDVVLSELLHRLLDMGVMWSAAMGIAEHLFVRHRIPVTAHERQMRRIMQRFPFGDSTEYS